MHRPARLGQSLRALNRPARSRTTHRAQKTCKIRPVTEIIKSLCKVGIVGGMELIERPNVYKTAIDMFAAIRAEVGNPAEHTEHCCTRCVPMAISPRTLSHSLCMTLSLAMPLRHGDAVPQTPLCVWQCGDDVDIATDFHGRSNPTISKILCKGLEPYYPMFVEEALHGQVRVCAVHCSLLCGRASTFHDECTQQCMQ